MNDGVKLIFGILLVLGIAFVAGSLFFPQVIESLNLRPIQFNWDAF